MQMVGDGFLRNFIAPTFLAYLPRRGTTEYFKAGGR
jgi:hypothetical protein